ncbi:tellurium resistance protein [Acinetobacter sp. WZC-1]|uniref:tellurium resistance protein n=1 Tax=Acinetobacter sp. WZC-1 TaxID=3459034 RepID=UPI00403DF440
MRQYQVLTPLEQIEIHPDALLSIKRNDLVPLLDDQFRLNHYADQVVQAQAVLLNGINPQLTQQLSQVVKQIVQHLSSSASIFRQRKFNALQTWLGQELESDARQLNCLKALEELIQQADSLSGQLRVELQKSQMRFLQATGYREKMALYIRAAQEFLQEYPDFMHTRQLQDHFSERLSKKINTLQTLQTGNDITLVQMQLAHRLSLDLMDRFKEAQQVLIPAWQYHLKQSRQQQSLVASAELDKSREQLIRILQQSSEKK